MFFIKLYLQIILILLLTPISLLLKIFSFKIRKKTNFNLYKKEKYFKIINFQFYSLLTFFLFIFFSPLIFLKKYSKKNLFKLKSKIVFQTPKQIASILAYRLINNIKLTDKIAEENNAKYHFILQPLLFSTSNKTKLDKKIMKNVSQTKYNGFSYDMYCNEYYKTLLLALEEEKKICGKYSDFSNFFENNDKQIFIDPVHIGSIGQAECAEKIGSIILSQENNKGNLQ